MPSISIEKKIVGEGANMVSTFQRTGSGVSRIVRTPQENTGLPIGYAGSLTTRTSDTQGTATLGAGHAITTGMEVDVYWTGGVRYGMTVGTVSGTSVPLTDSGAGDALPAQSTALVIAQRVEITESIVGDNLQFLAALLAYPNDPNNSAAGRCHIESRDSGDSEISSTAFELSARESTDFDVAGGATNPWAGEAVAKLIASNSNTTYIGRLELIWLQST